MTDTQHYRDKWATYDARLKEGDGNGSLMGACFIIAKSGVTDINALCDRIDALERLADGSSVYRSPNRFDDWDKMLANLDEIAGTHAGMAPIFQTMQLNPGRAVYQVQAIANELRHVVRYARDGEAGNRILRERVWELGG
jgi:hypothetical protein